MGRKFTVVVGYDKDSENLMLNFGNVFVLDPALWYKKDEEAIFDYVKENIMDCKLMLFTGGADVSPDLYGDSSPAMCFSSKRRDALDITAFKMAGNIPKVGICRGIQFLNVMAGGKLIHHVNKHCRRSFHMMETINDGEIQVNTLHHQLTMPHKGMIVEGVASPKLKGEEYYGNEDKLLNYTGPEVEAAWFPEINAFGVQYHPEMLPSTEKCRKWFLEKVEVLLNKNKEIKKAATT